MSVSPTVKSGCTGGLQASRTLQHILLNVVDAAIPCAKLHPITVPLLTALGPLYPSPSCVMLATMLLQLINLAMQRKQRAWRTVM